MAREYDFTKISDDCIKCGKCTPGCTINLVNNDEVTSPRGFLDLLGAYKRGELPLDKTAKDIFESCFLCTHCTDVCPNSLPTDTMIEEVRADIADKYGIAWYKKGFFFLLRHRLLMDIVNKLGFMFKSCALKQENNGLSTRFTLPIIKKGRLLPSMASKSFLNSYPQNIQGSNGKVAIFIGCLANYNYTKTGDALVKILKALDKEIFIPKKQKCCGAPAYFTGDFDTVLYLIKQNVAYFETFIDEVEAIIIPEATCSAMITHDWEVFLRNRGENALAQRVAKMKDKIFIATQWLEKQEKLKALLAKNKVATTVTYHDPCHAKKVQGVYKEPRTLLGQSYTLVEMSDPNRCCGFGGVTMQTEKYRYAKAAGKPKAQMIAQTNAQVVSAECSACRMQLSDAMHQKGVNVTFKNPIELIADALKD